MPHNDIFKYITLEPGKLLKDYIQTNGTYSYKIYKYNNTSTQTRIILTPENGLFQIFVFDNTFDGKVSFNKDSKMPQGFVNSSYESELVLTNTPPGDIYIMVLMSDLYLYNNNNQNYTKSFVIGATNEKIPFYIKEGISTLASLSIDVKSQEYVYNHYNLTQSLYIGFNVYYGTIDIQIDSKPIVDKVETPVFKYNTVSLFIFILIKLHRLLHI